MAGRTLRGGCAARLAILLLVAGLGAVGLALLYQVPAVHERVHWRVQAARVDLIRLVRPQADTLPTPPPAETADALAGLLATSTPAPTDTAAPSPTAAPVTASPAPTEPPTPTATPLPASAMLTDLVHEYQGWNNCGPATLSMNLRYWGWQGDQKITAAWLKPNTEDKNVRADEMEAYVNEQAPGYAAVYRAGGTLDLMERLIANGYPVLAGRGLWYGEQGWMGHYVLLVGYDAEAQEFVVADSLKGPNRRETYAEFDADWQAFNRLFVLVYPEARAAEAAALLGEHADPAGSFRQALETARAETAAHPGNAFAWHNLGTNLEYFEDHASAALAFDEARRIGLPWRMLWYQDGLYSAYYHAGRYQDVLTLANITLDSTLGVDLEESLYWRGWARHVLGDGSGARRDFERALAFNPNFERARGALAELE